MMQEEARLLEQAVEQAAAGALSYAALMEALGRAVAEGAEVLAIRSPREQLLPDGTPQVELLKVSLQGRTAWLCLSGQAHAEALEEKQGGVPVSVAAVSLGTLLSMAEDSGIDALVFNPDRAPNLVLGAAEFAEIRRCSERYTEEKRSAALKKAASRAIPGWIM